MKSLNYKSVFQTAKRQIESRMQDHKKWPSNGYQEQARGILNLWMCLSFEMEDDLLKLDQHSEKIKKDHEILESIIYVSEEK